MPGFKIRILDEATQELAKLDQITSRRIVQRIKWLADNLEVTRLEMLTGDLAGFYILRVGDYRVVYEVLWDEQSILIHAIAHRSKIYRKR